MKTRSNILFLLFLSLSIVSCDKPEAVVTDPLDGVWNLTSVICFCTPLEFDPGVNLWTINISENQVIVDNNAVGEFHTVLDSGSYGIEVTNETFKIDGITYDYELEGDVLVLSDNPELDGPSIKFVR